MSTTLTIIAHIEAKEEKSDFVKSEALRLIEPTRKEEGCLQYDLHQDQQKPAVLIFVEKWESKALWQKHMESKHLKTFVDNVDNALENLTINQMSQIG